MSVIDTEIKENIRTIGIGILPKKMALDPAGKRLFIVAQNSAIKIIDTLKQKRLKSIPTDITPSGLVFVPKKGEE